MQLFHKRGKLKQAQYRNIRKLDNEGHHLSGISTEEQRNRCSLTEPLSFIYCLHHLSFLRFLTETSLGEDFKGVCIFNILITAETQNSYIIFQKIGD